ncbi:hypothetical protein [Streptomyces sp. WAC04114]|nr:hypothetical protein [Streptomyces sp. WAC04114]
MTSRLSPAGPENDPRKVDELVGGGAAVPAALGVPTGPGKT